MKELIILARMNNATEAAKTLHIINKFATAINQALVTQGIDDLPYIETGRDKTVIKIKIRP